MRLPLSPLARLVLLVGVLASVAALAAIDSPYTVPSVAMGESFSGTARTDGFCVRATATAANAWLSAPARITAGVQRQVRFVIVQHGDNVNQTNRTCWKLGPTASADGLTCTGDTGTAGLLTGYGAADVGTLARDAASSSPNGVTGPPPIWIRSDDAGGTLTCIKIGF
ncbi:MAG: hypothetical protein WCO19_01880 [Candidatus Saccharibacteria bacterium]